MPHRRFDIDYRIDSLSLRYQTKGIIPESLKSKGQFYHAQLRAIGYVWTDWPSL